MLWSEKVSDLKTFWFKWNCTRWCLYVQSVECHNGMNAHGVVTLGDMTFIK